VHRARALPVRRAEAVGAGVAAADDDDVLVLGGNGLRLRDFLALVPAVLLGEVLHREVDALEIAPLHRQVARTGRSPGEDDGVELGAQFFNLDVDADVRVRAE
jgi:hypothetical protein